MFHNFLYFAFSIVLVAMMSHYLFNFPIANCTFPPVLPFWDQFDIQKHWATSAHKAPFKSIVLRCHAYNTTLRLRRRFVGHKKERQLKISLYWSLPLKLKVDKMWNLSYIFLCVGEYIGNFLYLSTFQVKSVMIINNNEDL